MAEDSPCLSTSTSFSILSRLQALQLSDLAQVKSNPPKGKKQWVSSGVDHNPKSVTPSQRVHYFPNECLTVSVGKLFRTACREEVGLKQSIVRFHTISQKHHKEKEQLAMKEVQERDIASSYGSDQRQAGSTIPTDQQVYRIKVLRIVLRAGIPIL